MANLLEGNARAAGYELVNPHILVGEHITVGLSSQSRGGGGEKLLLIGGQLLDPVKLLSDGDIDLKPLGQGRDDFQNVL